jgi:WD40 repeat protein/tetratricopeptide (TPR) repeat protein
LLMDVDFSADGKWLAAAGLGGLAQVWNADTLAEYHLFTGHQGLVFRAAFSPNSKILATCGTDSTVRLWDLKSKELIISLSPGPNVRTLAFSPDGNRLAAGSWNGIVKVWQLSLDTNEIIREIGHHQLDSERVRAMEFSPDSQYLAVACSDGSLRVWHPVNGTEIRHFFAHSGSAINIAFHPQGHRLVTSGIDHKVKYWDLAADPEPKNIFPHDAQISALAMSPHGQLMAIAGGENHVNVGFGRKTLNIWSFTKNEVIHRLAEHKGWLTSVAFSPNGDQVLSGSEDQSAILWDVASGKVLQRFVGHGGAVTGVAFVTKNAEVATASADGTIKFWDTRTGKEIATLSGHDAAVNAIAADLEKGLLVSASDDATIRIWSIRDLRTLAILRGHERSVSDVQFSADGNLVASCGKDGGLFVWQRGSSQQPSDAWPLKNRLQLKNGGNVKHIAFHPNGNRLVGVTEDATLTLWDVDTGQEAFSQRIGPESLVSGDVEFSADGNRLVSSYALQIAVRSVQGNAPHAFDTARAIDWHTRRSVECRTDSNWRGMLFHLDHLVAVEPTNWMSHLSRADIYGRLGDWHASENAYAEGLERIAAVGELSYDQKLNLARQYYSSANIHYGGGRTKTGRELFDKAIAVLESMRESSPNDLRCTRELAKMLRLFGYLQKSYDLEEAERAMARAVTLSDFVLQAEPNSLADQVDLCNALLNLATVISKDCRQPLIERAKNVLEPLVNTYPGNWIFREWLATCLDDYGVWLEEDGQHAKAEELMMRGLDLRVKLVAEYPNDLHRRDLLARSYIRLAEPTFTCVPREQARQFWRHHLKTLQAVLRLQAQSGRISAGTADDLSWTLSTCLIHEFRDAERALEWGKIAVKEAPEDSSYWNTLAMAYYRNGQWESAQRSYQKAMELRNGGDSFDWYGLAMASWQLGQHDQARDWLTKARQWNKEKASYNGILRDLDAEAVKLITASPNPPTPLVAENSSDADSP